MQISYPMLVLNVELSLSFVFCCLFVFFCFFFFWGGGRFRGWGGLFTYNGLFVIFSIMSFSSASDVVPSNNLKLLKMNALNISQKSKKVTVAYEIIAFWPFLPMYV